MVNKIIQAVAGAGKTHYVTNEISESKKTLYITFTNGNVLNIQEELNKKRKPCDTYRVITFAKFIDDWCIRPFFPSLKPSLGEFKGFTPIEPPENNRNPNNGYVKKEYKGHFIDSNGKLFLNRISELIMFQDAKLHKKIFARMSKYIDLIVVDEYQDLTGKDFNFLQKLIKQKFVDVILTGDIFQAGVSQSSRRKKSKLLDYDGKESIEAFLKGKFNSKNIEIDVDSLKLSRRISPACANFVKIFQLNLKEFLVHRSLQ